MCDLNKNVMGPEEKLKAMGIELPTPKPVDTDAWNLVLCRQVGNLVYVSGEGPEFPDGTWISGRLGEEKLRKLQEFALSTLWHL